MSGAGDDQRMQLAHIAPPATGSDYPAPGAYMHTELESMREFKKRVDGMIDRLNGSEAEPARVADRQLPPHSLGVGFAEATGLHSAYTQVHDQLTSLSRLLAGQISALSTAIDGARHGYETVDLQARDEMWSIQASSQEHYQPERDPYAEEHGRADGANGPQGNGGGGNGNGGEQAPDTNKGTEDKPAGDDGRY